MVEEHVVEEMRRRKKYFMNTYFLPDIRLPELAPLNIYPEDGN
jgi:hypothetical protein